MEVKLHVTVLEKLPLVQTPPIIVHVFKTAFVILVSLNVRVLSLSSVIHQILSKYCTQLSDKALYVQYASHDYIYQYFDITFTDL